MKTKQRNLVLTLLSFIMAFALVLGFSSALTAVASESDATTITMQNGAKLRVEEGAPALIYTAEIKNYDDQLEYGILLIPVSLTEGVADYVGSLSQESYQKIKCEPYGTETKKITAYFDIESDKLTTEYAGIAYIFDGETYVYTQVTKDNVRSVEYVAQMAYLKGDGDKDVLESFISSEVKEDSFGVDIEEAKANEVILDGTNSYISLVIDNLNQADAGQAGSDGSSDLSFRTKECYEAGSIVTFDVLVPEEMADQQIKFGTSYSRLSGLSIYEGSNISGVVAGEWTNVKCTISKENTDTSYFWVFATKGEWHNEDGDVLYELCLDNFVVTEPSGKTYTQDFENGYSGGDDNTTVNFVLNGNPDKGIDVEDVAKYVTFGGSMTMGDPAPDYMLAFNGKAIGDTSENIAFVTDIGYRGISEITFDAIWTGNCTSDRWGLSYTTNPSSSSYSSSDVSQIYPYSAKFGELAKTAEAAISYKITIQSNGQWDLYSKGEMATEYARIQGSNAGAYVDGENYLYFIICPNVYGDGDAFYIDNFTITYAGGVVTDGFDYGKSSLFVESRTKNTSYGSKGMSFQETKFPEKKDDSLVGDTELVFDGTAISNMEKIAIVTNSTYQGISEITFNAMWTGNCTSDRWGLAYTTNPSSSSQGTAISKVDPYRTRIGEFKKDAGVWYSYKVTITSAGKWELYGKTESETEYTRIQGSNDGAYQDGQNYIYFVVCPAVGGSGVAFHIDDFSITYAGGTAVDTFDNGASSLFVDSATVNTIYGSAGMGFILPDEDLGDGDGGDEQEPVEVTFDSLVQSGKIMNYLSNLDGKVYWGTSVTFDGNALSDDKLLFNANFDLAFNESRDFVLTIDEKSFLYFNGEIVALYQNGALVSSIDYLGDNVDIAVKADGNVFVNAGNGYEFIGAIDLSNGLDFKIISLFGEGTFTVSNLRLCTYDVPTVI